MKHIVYTTTGHKSLVEMDINDIAKPTEHAYLHGRAEQSQSPAASTDPMPCIQSVAA